MDWFNKTIISFLFLFFSIFSSATTIQKIDFEELVQDAGLIFEGRCIDVVSVAVPNSRFIQTLVTFEVIDVIKGNYSNDSIQLEYLGGKIGKRELKIDNMNIPGFNEKGIFFVGELGKKNIHPLLGWDQGYITIYSDSDGHERIGTFDYKPIIELEAKVEQQAPASRTVLKSQGVAKGIQYTETLNWNKAITKSDFKNKIKNILNK